MNDSQIAILARGAIKKIERDRGDGHDTPVFDRLLYLLQEILDLETAKAGQ